MNSSLAKAPAVVINNNTPAKVVEELEFEFEQVEEPEVVDSGSDWFFWLMVVIFVLLIIVIAAAMRGGSSGNGGGTSYYRT